MLLPWFCEFIGMPNAFEQLGKNISTMYKWNESIFSGSTSNKRHNVKCIYNLNTMSKIRILAQWTVDIVLAQAFKMWWKKKSLKLGLFLLELFMEYRTNIMRSLCITLSSVHIMSWKRFVWKAMQSTFQTSNFPYQLYQCVISGCRRRSQPKTKK